MPHGRFAIIPGICRAAGEVRAPVIGRDAARYSLSTALACAR
jgi:hypothetical protein